MRGKDRRLAEKTDALEALNAEHAATVTPRVYAALSMRHHPVVSPESTRGANLATLNDDGQEALYIAMLSCLCRHYHLSFARVRASGRTNEVYEATAAGLPAFGQAMPRSASAKLTAARDKAHEKSARRAGG